MIIFLVCLGQLFLPDVYIRSFRACVFYLRSINNLSDRFSSCFLPFPFSKSPCAWSNVFYLWIAWEYYHWIPARKKKHVKNLPAMQELQGTWVQSLEWQDPLKDGMATHSSILDWRIPWTEEPGSLQSRGSQRVGHDWATELTTTV